MSNVIAEFEVNTQQTIENEFSVQVVNNDHSILNNRDMADQHPISAITGLEEALAQHTDAQWGSITGDIESQTDLQNALATKQDVIADLSTIRSGAELGATSVQSVTEGTTNGTIKVDGNAVSVYGLGSAAYTSSTDYATSAQGSKADTAVQPSDLPTVNNATLTIQKNSATAGTFTANSSTDTTINITVPTTASDVGALANTTKYGASLSLSINSSTYVITAQLKDQNGDNLGSAQTIDLPLESVVVSGSYDDETKKIILTLQNGSTVEFSVADLVSGLQSEITSENMLDADLVDDSTSTNKFVTASEKSAISTAVQPADITNMVTTNTTQTISGEKVFTGIVSIPAGKTYITAGNGGAKLGYFTYDIDGGSNITLQTMTASTRDINFKTNNGGKLKYNGNEVAIVSNIPTVNNATLTIQKNGVDVQTFTANASTNATANITVPTDTGDLTNGAGFITGITSSDVTTALGYTPYNSSNPSGYQANVIETVKVNGTALTPSSKAVDISVPTKTSDLNNDSGFITTSALSGYATETWVGNQGYITGITSGDVTTALGYTPYSDANPDGYTSNVGTVTSVNNTSPDGNGNVTLSIPAAQVNSDWNANSGVAQILNKPTIPTDTSDLTNNAGFITGISSSDVTTALGYTPLSPSDIADSVDSSSTNSETVGAKLFYDTCGDIETLINAL